MELLERLKLAKEKLEAAIEAEANAYEHNNNTQAASNEVYYNKGYLQALVDISKKDQA